MIRPSLLTEIFNTSCIQRWNDKLRPIDLPELDFQAHRMMIVYFLGKFEESNKKFRWKDVIEGGVFDLLETAVLTDLRWNVKETLKRHPERRKRLDQYVLQQLEPLLSELNEDLFDRFRRYKKGHRANTLARRLLLAAGAHAREWEFRILEYANPEGYEIQKIRKAMNAEKEKHSLHGCNQLHKYSRYKRFIDVCSELRFQGRWSHLHMSPRISVLGHSMVVAAVSYLFSLEAGACERQQVNNFLLGLFHDLAESQTRDVRSPLKDKVPVIGETLEEIGAELMEREVIGLLPPSWRAEFRLFSLTELGVDSAVLNNIRTRVTSEDLFGQYNADNLNPIGGSLVKAADNLSAFLESVQAVRNGCGNPEVQAAVYHIAKLYENSRIGKLDLGLLYRELLTR